MDGDEQVGVGAVGDMRCALRVERGCRPCACRQLRRRGYFPRSVARGEARRPGRDLFRASHAALWRPVSKPPWPGSMTMRLIFRPSSRVSESRASGVRAHPLREPLAGCASVEPGLDLGLPARESCLSVARREIRCEGSRGVESRWTEPASNEGCPCMMCVMPFNMPCGSAKPAESRTPATAPIQRPEPGRPNCLVSGG